ncbi:hypothetical protein AB833_24910 [Chromatiales bacterium (ex Bugula neritina AB1)]|nr:hypothetical protein AB833_24910 [Chromatiales bacterium (ex Bugula neritina AB1)]
MANRKNKQNAQSRGQKRKRKEDKRKKQKNKALNTKSATVTIGKKQLEQLQNLTPVAWAAENRLDVALFDQSVFGQLDPQDQQLVTPVINALEHVAHGRMSEAETALSAISRKSPMRDWRQLVSGLQHWYANDLPAAANSWSRLDPSRRPARISQTLMLAHRSDLSSLSTAHTNTGPHTGSPETPPAAVGNPADSTVTEQTAQKQPGAASDAIDKSMLIGARVVRRARIDRAAIKIARAATEYEPIDEHEQQLQPGAKLKVSPEQIFWLKEFARGFRHSEPELVRKLEIVALERATQQPYSDLFELTVKNIRGLDHDPRNNLRSYRYWNRFEDGAIKAQMFLTKYLNQDLASNTNLSEPLRNALTSVVNLNEAEELIQSNDMLLMGLNPFGGIGIDAITKKRITVHLVEAVTAYPANRDAHIAYTDWLDKEIEDCDGDKQAIKELKTRQLAAMKCWANAIDSDLTPRQYLVDVLLNDEQLEEATPHVEWLVKSRPDDPGLKALPWKLQLLKAMKLCRRISNLPQVPAKLAEVESIWPEWLPKQWLPYYTAAWMLRSGDKKNYEAQRNLIATSSGIERDSLADACMMLGAAQNMRVAAADLKPLRMPVDSAVKAVKSLSFDSLIAAGSFFWTTRQSKIQYPALRMHASKIGREILHRLSIDTTLVAKHIDKQIFLDAVLWMSEYRFWSNTYQLTIPRALQEQVTHNTYITAAILNLFARSRGIWTTEEIPKYINSLKNSTRTEPNPFYRFWFANLIDDLDAIERKYKAMYSRGNPFGGRPNNPFDDICECPACRARRAQEEKQQQRAEAAKLAREKDQYTSETGGAGSQTELF